MDIHNWINEDLWQKQRAYNKKIRDLEHTNNKEYWTKQYLLGIVSEIDEVLQQVNWKIHRKGKPTDRYNLGRELADITKYVWSLWELHDFTYSDMLEYVKEKTEELHLQWLQDFVWKIEPDCKVIITDIDGTLGDWRSAFINWLNEQKPETVIPQDAGKNMAIEIDIGIPYPEYMLWKEKFEAEGGYRLLEPYPDTKDFLKTCSESGIKIIAYTSRPADRYSRIWTDSWYWITKHEISVDELRIGSEERIARACSLRDQGHKVVMLEDDPSLALRAASTNITVFLRNQTYNEGVSHPNICRIDSFNELEIF